MRKLRPTVKAALVGIAAGTILAAIQTRPTPAPIIIPAKPLARVVVPSPPVFTIPETSEFAEGFLGRPDDEWTPPKKGKRPTFPATTKKKKGVAI